MGTEEFNLILIWHFILYKSEIKTENKERNVLSLFVLSLRRRHFNIK